MSEMRKLKAKVDKDFADFCKSTGLRVVENGEVVMFFKSMNSTAKNVVQFPNTRFTLGVNDEGELIYDDMISSKVNNLLSDYYVKKLSKRGRNVTKEKEGNKIVLKVG